MSDEKKTFKAKATTMVGGRYVYEGETVRATADEVKGVEHALEEVKVEGEEDPVEMTDAAPSETPTHQTKRTVPAKTAADKKAAKAEEN